MKIAGLTILFNPDADVFANIQSYAKTLDTVYVVDNSDLHKNEIIKKITADKKIRFISNNGNNGVAHALNVGCALAKSDGFDWLLTMDQDSSFSEPMLTAYLHCFENYIDRSIVAIFSPLQTSPANFNEPTKSDCQSSEQTILMTSGNLLNLELFEKIGRFEEKLFIDEVDHDYCLRATLYDFKLIRFDNIFMKHQLGQQKKIAAFFESRTVNTPAPERLYYIARNNLYISVKYCSNFPELCINRLFSLAKLIAFSIAFDDRKFLRLYFFSKGLFHFTIGRFGKL